MVDITHSTLSMEPNLKVGECQDSANDLVRDNPIRLRELGTYRIDCIAFVSEIATMQLSEALCEYTVYCPSC